MSDQFNLIIHDFRAIQHAEIALNGLTVVTGLNGCGKSTLSRLFYRLFYVANNYEKIVLERLALKRNILWVSDFFDRLRFRYRSEGLKNLPRFLRSGRSIDSFEAGFNESFNQLKEYYKQLGENGTEFLFLKRILRERFPKKSESPESLDFLDLLEYAEKAVKKEFQQSRGELENRSLFILENDLRDCFQEILPIERLQLQEAGQDTLDFDKKMFLPLFGIKKVAYIDSPMAVGLERGYRSAWRHWEEINSLMRRKRLLENPYQDLINYIKKSVLHGSVDSPKEELGPREFQFVFEGSESSFNLSQCATGIKSFSVLLLLLENGFLDDSSLLIVDEPEAHLHPAWVVEYAKILVLLVKEVGVKLFIASHDPDMVSALKNISDAYEMGAKVNFYQAEPGSGASSETEAKKTIPPRFNYKPLKNNTGPIHTEFNKAFDLTDKYCEEAEAEASSGNQGSKEE